MTTWPPIAVEILGILSRFLE